MQMNRKRLWKNFYDGPSNYLWKPRRQERKEAWECGKADRAGSSRMALSLVPNRLHWCHGLDWDEKWNENRRADTHRPYLFTNTHLWNETIPKSWYFKGAYFTKSINRWIFFFFCYLYEEVANCIYDRPKREPENSISFLFFDS